MKLSIVIVNYNVRYFLEQCLHAVFKAIEPLQAEVFVVDNASADNSVAMVREKFPQVKLIANTDNPGFSKANNQAIKQATGEYVLLLNPDTIVGEHTFTKILDFMDAHPDAGASGIRMVDGQGIYLPESKRGLPTPKVAFYKISGLTSIFSKSEKFAQYYMGHLPETANNPIEVLAGAFMMMRKTALEKAGLLDEDFFMYGEDIDLSYRITKAGYKNYYFADDSIVHYKGESTKKGSLNYVYVFYKAMEIFAKKHFSQSYARAFGILLYFAIWARASISVLKRVFSKSWLPVLDFVVLMIGLFFIKDYWEHNHRFISGGTYPPALLQVAFPLYSITWLLGLWITAAYRKPTRTRNIFKGIFIGSLLILIGYSLVPEDYRFSRAIILLGVCWALITLPVLRLLLQWIFKVKLLQSEEIENRILWLSSNPKTKEVGHKAFDNIAFEMDFSGHASADELSKIIKAFKITHVVLDPAELSYEGSIKILEKLPPDCAARLVSENHDFIIGSDSVHTRGGWHSKEQFKLFTPAAQREKRMFDIVASFLLLLLSPILLPLQKKGGYYTNLFKVLRGKATWVGYAPIAEKHLPKGKSFVILYEPQKLNLTHELKQQTSVWYAKQYTTELDVRMLWKRLFHLGTALQG